MPPAASLCTHHGDGEKQTNRQREQVQEPKLGVHAGPPMVTALYVGAFVALIALAVLTIWLLVLVRPRWFDG